MKQTNHFTRPEYWSTEQRRKVRQQIKRTNSEAQKVENIVYYFMAQTSEESNIYTADGDIGQSMEDREELNFIIELSELKHYMDNMTVHETVSFIETAITDYTFFSSVDITDQSRDNGSQYVKIRARK